MSLSYHHPAGHHLTHRLTKWMGDRSLHRGSFHRRIINIVLSTVRVKMHGIAIGLVIVLLCSICSWWLSTDFVTCTVSGAGFPPVNGWYSAISGNYYRRGHNILFFPDVFQIFSLRKEKNGIQLSSTKDSWIIASPFSDKPLYVSTPSDPDQHLFSPPPDEWKTGDLPGVNPPPTVTSAIGSLADSPPSHSHQMSNIQQLFMRPVTTSLLGIIGYYYYRLWADRTDPGEVAFSYESIVIRGEWWRMVTASFAHFDLWHVFFNTMGLYQFGDLEFSYGSVVFGFLNVDLVFITMGICLIVHYVMVYKYHREEFLYQQAVGFSCVLFAWMVAASVRMNEFCPVFFLPSLCFQTYSIPNPFGWSLPVNGGPILILIATKLIIPRSSFIGHLSGIIIGYPVAWNALDWLSPPLFLSLIALGFIYHLQLYPWKFTGFDRYPENNDLISPIQTHKYRMLQYFSYPLMVGSVIAAVFFGPLLALARGTLAYLLYSALHARRMEWLLDPNHASYVSCVYILSLTVVALASAVIYDACNLFSAVAAVRLLYGCTLSQTFVLVVVLLLLGLFLLELLCFMGLVLCMHEVLPCGALLSRCRLDEASVTRDAQMLGLVRLLGMFSGITESAPQPHIFDRGPGHVLGLRSMGGGSHTHTPVSQEDTYTDHGSGGGGGGLPMPPPSKSGNNLPPIPVNSSGSTNTNPLPLSFPNSRPNASINNSNNSQTKKGSTLTV